MRAHGARRANRPRTGLPRARPVRDDRQGTHPARRLREPRPAEDLQVTSTGLLRCTSCGAGMLAGEGFCEACGVPVAPAVPDFSTLDLKTAAVVSDRGLVHDHNQDACALLQV